MWLSATLAGDVARCHAGCWLGNVHPDNDVSLYNWSMWRYLVGPRGVIWLVHVALSGWSTCRYLVGPCVTFLLVHVGLWEYGMLLFLVTTRGCFWWCHVSIFLLGHVSTCDCTTWLLLDAQHMFTSTFPPFWTHSDTVTFSTFPHLDAQHMFRSIPPYSRHIT
jgi:hypothetical protein